MLEQIYLIYFLLFLIGRKLLPLNLFYLSLINHKSSEFSTGSASHRKALITSAPDFVFLILFYLVEWPLTAIFSREWSQNGSTIRIGTWLCAGLLDLRFEPFDPTPQREKVGSFVQERYFAVTLYRLESWDFQKHRVWLKPLGLDGLCSGELWPEALDTASFTYPWF